MEKFTHKCLVCEKEFSESSNLFRHMRQRHSTNDDDIFMGRNKPSCPLCGSRFMSKPRLEIHLSTIHKIQLFFEMSEFKCMEDFLNWKKEIEEKSASIYVKKGGTRFAKGKKKKTYYYCHKSGTFSTSGKGLRKLKKLGSNKIDSTCPSMMKVVEDEDKVVVEFCATHVGHESSEVKAISKKSKEVPRHQAQ